LSSRAADESELGGREGVGHRQDRATACLGISSKQWRLPHQGVTVEVATLLALGGGLAHGNPSFKSHTTDLLLSFVDENWASRVVYPKLLDAHRELLVVGVRRLRPVQDLDPGAVLLHFLGYG
jgi:hypothetical protein